METGKSDPRSTRQPSTQRGLGSVQFSRIPLEWMAQGVWRLPSGKALAEFALQAGFLAPLLLGSPKFTKGPRKQGAKKDDRARNTVRPER